MKMITQIPDIPNSLNLIVSIKMIQAHIKNLGYYNGPISGKNTEKGYYKAIVAAHKALGIPVDDSGKKIHMEARGPFLTALCKTSTALYDDMKPIVAADHVMSCPDELWALDIPEVADMPLPSAVAEQLSECLTRISEKQALPLRLKSEDIKVSEDGKLQIKLTVPGNGWLSSTGDFYKALPMGVTSIISIYMRKAGYTVTAGDEDGSVTVHGDLSIAAVVQDKPSIIGSFDKQTLTPTKNQSNQGIQNHFNWSNGRPYYLDPAQFEVEDVLDIEKQIQESIRGGGKASAAYKKALKSGNKEIFDIEGVGFNMTTLSLVSTKSGRGIGRFHGHIIGTIKVNKDTRYEVKATMTFDLGDYNWVADGTSTLMNAAIILGGIRINRHPDAVADLWGVLGGLQINFIQMVLLLN